MMIQMLDVQEYGPDHLMLALDVTDDDGNTVRMAHFMPRDAAEWRVAEYGLDPDDHDTLIDVLLHEGHAQADLAPEDTLHNAPTVEHARDALLGAVRARKATSEAKRTAARGGRPDPEPEVRQRMAGLFSMHPEAVQAKREFVEKMRGQSARPPAPLTAADRIAAVRAATTDRSTDASVADH